MRPCERVMAALGLLPGGATTQFQSCRDVSYGGVLCALPALAENGLFRHLETLPVLSGYYVKLHVILLLAYMALCRIKAVEQLQYETPGELGKLMGLDRIPEVRCLRKKMSQLSRNESPQRWAAVLSQDWMQQSPELAGMLYVDGHVRLYHGQQTQLPRRYVARQRLCMRGTTDYWINDVLGQPFFSIDRPVDHGLLEEIQQLEHELDQVKNLMKEAPQHLKWNELPQADKFEQLAPSRKRLTDTVKMIAYRAETAMAGIVREELARTDDARSLLRDLFRSEADLLPDLNEGVLRVNVHPMANARSNHAIQYLLNHLNTAAYTYPGTNLQLVYSLVGDPKTKIGDG